MHDGITIPVGPEICDDSEDEHGDIHVSIHPSPKLVTGGHAYPSSASKA